MMPAECQSTRPERCCRKDPTATTGHDRGQRGRLGAELRETEAERQRRHEHDAAAHAEEAGERSAGETERQCQRDVAHQASLPATTTITQANASCRCGPRTRCGERRAEARRPTTAGRPISSASRQTTRSSNA